MNSELIIKFFTKRYKEKGDKFMEKIVIALGGNALQSKGSAPTAAGHVQVKGLRISAVRDTRLPSYTATDRR